MATSKLSYLCNLATQWQDPTLVASALRDFHLRAYNRALENGAYICDDAGADESMKNRIVAVPDIVGTIVGVRLGDLRDAFRAIGTSETTDGITVQVLNRLSDGDSGTEAVETITVNLNQVSDYLGSIADNAYIQYAAFESVAAQAVDKAQSFFQHIMLYAQSKSQAVCSALVSVSTLLRDMVGDTGACVQALAEWTGINNIMNADELSPNSGSDVAITEYTGASVMPSLISAYINLSLAGSKAVLNTAAVLVTSVARLWWAVQKLQFKIGVYVWNKISTWFRTSFLDPVDFEITEGERCMYLQYGGYVDVLAADTNYGRVGQLCHAFCDTTWDDGNQCVVFSCSHAVYQITPQVTSEGSRYLRVRTYYKPVDLKRLEGVRSSLSALANAVYSNGNRASFDPFNRDNYRWQVYYNRGSDAADTPFPTYAPAGTGASPRDVYTTVNNVSEMFAYWQQQDLSLDAKCSELELYQGLIAARQLEAAFSGIQAKIAYCLSVATGKYSSGVGEGSAIWRGLYDEADLDAKICWSTWRQTGDLFKQVLAYSLFSLMVAVTVNDAISGRYTDARKLMLYPNLTDSARPFPVYVNRGTTSEWRAASPCTTPEADISNGAPDIGLSFIPVTYDWFTSVFAPLSSGRVTNASLMSLALNRIFYDYNSYSSAGTPCKVVRFTAGEDYINTELHAYNRGVFYSNPSTTPTWRLPLPKTWSLGEMRDMLSIYSVTYQSAWETAEYEDVPLCFAIPFVYCAALQGYVSTPLRSEVSLPVAAGYHHGYELPGVQNIRIKTDAENEANAQRAVLAAVLTIAAVAVTAYVGVKAVKLITQAKKLSASVDALSFEYGTAVNEGRTEDAKRLWKQRKSIALKSKIANALRGSISSETTSVLSSELAMASGSAAQDTQDITEIKKRIG